MKFAYRIWILILIVAWAVSGNAQTVKEDEIVVIQGEKYIIHQIRTGETIYSISNRYQVKSEELIRHNPFLEAGPKIGDIIKVPYREGLELQDLPASPKGDPVDFEYFTITSRTETPYFISRSFGISVEELYAYNPEITRFRKGTRLRIPRWEKPEPISPAEPEPLQIDSDLRDRELIMHEVLPGETLYSLSRKYRIPESEILFFNPGARELKAGSVIYLPRPEGYEEEADPYRDREAEPEGAFPGAAGTAYAGYFEHTILSGETVWSITRKYDVSEEELRQRNPRLGDDFPAGVTLRIPVREPQGTPPKPVNEEAFLRHEVAPGETLYGLATQYGLTIPDIRRFNPPLHTRNPVAGETLLIPILPEETTAITETEAVSDTLPETKPRWSDDYYKIDFPAHIPESCRPFGEEFTRGEVCQIALFLPLFIRDNDLMNPDPNWQEETEPIDSIMITEEFEALEQDTLIELEIPPKSTYAFYRESEKYLQFYEGVLLAVDSMQRAGMNLRLNVYDSQHNPDSIRKFIYTKEFLETDLIIGPVYTQEQEEVAAIAAKNRIPMISPLTSQSYVIDSNPWYFQINPTRNVLINKTADLITEEFFNSNLIVIETNHSPAFDEARVIDRVREQMEHSGYLNQPGGMQIDTYIHQRNFSGFRELLSREKENVIFISSLHEGDLSVILSNINNLTGRYSFTLIGFNRYEQFQSINEEFYHNLKLHYVTPYWTDYQNPETIRFLEKFRNHFYAEPGNFGMQGYDVTFYFLNALRNFGRNFAECLPYQEVHQVQGSYRFEKVSAYGGYMNQGVSVISYEPDFDVVRKRVEGPLRLARDEAN